MYFQRVGYATGWTTARLKEEGRCTPEEEHEIGEAFIAWAERWPGRGQTKPEGDGKKRRRKQRTERESWEGYFSKGTNPTWDWAKLQGLANNLKKLAASEK